jgi:hypothetical protein
MKCQSAPRWAVKWISQNRISGRDEHLVFDHGVPVLFPTRSRARQWIRERYGYIKTRPDLRSEPHGWRMPKPVRVVVVEAP